MAGNLFEAAALDRGHLVIVQPLLVTTVVFALPLGYFLTSQRIAQREIAGAAGIVLGLAAFVVFGDPAGGRDSAPAWQWAITIVVLGALSAVLLLVGRRGGPSTRAAVYGAAAGIFYGLAAALAKPALEALHEGLAVMLEQWELYALLVAGVLGFVFQQVSLGTGRLAPAVATMSVASPVVGVLIGIVLLEERLSRPNWHIVVALIGLGLALVGAVVISLAREAGKEAEPEAPATDAAMV
jgi:drug/metabolite transporter (DMT)-like permease